MDGVRWLAKFSILTRLLPSQSPHQMVSGIHDADGASVPSVNPCRLDHNREARGIYGQVYETVGPSRAGNPAHAWVGYPDLCGWMKTSSCPRSDARLSNP